VRRSEKSSLGLVERFTASRASRTTGRRGEIRMHKQEHSRGNRRCGDAAKLLPLLVLTLGLAAFPVMGDPARARDAHYSKAYKGVKADGLKDQRLWKIQGGILGPLSAKRCQTSR
jgi:hypothetical protein